MRLVFTYPCHVGIVTADGDMTTAMFNLGDAVNVVNAGCLLLDSEPRTHMDFELEDGTLLLNVPFAAIRMMESELCQSV